MGSGQANVKYRVGLCCTTNIDLVNDNTAPNKKDTISSLPPELTQGFFPTFINPPPPSLGREREPTNEGLVDEICGLRLYNKWYQGIKTHDLIETVEVSNLMLDANLHRNKISVTMVSLPKTALTFLSISYLVAVNFCLATEPIGIYWGQESPKEVSLNETCLSGKYTYVNIAFLSRFGNGQTPELSLANHCNSSSNGCTHLSSEIKVCQELGIKVMLAIGGGSSNYSLVSVADAKNVSVYLWNSFLGGRSSSYSRPFGNAMLDGIDLMPQFGHQWYWEDLAQSLLEYYNGTHHKFYLSANSGCSYADAVVRYALESSHFDYVWVDFYGETSCSYLPGKTENLIYTWNLWTSLVNATIFLGLPATPKAANGFIPADVLVSQILPVVKKSPKYGGLMLWSKFYDDQSGYSSSIIELSSHNVSICSLFSSMLVYVMLDIGITAGYDNR